MFKKLVVIASVSALVVIIISCANSSNKPENKKPAETTYKMAKYADFTLITDISHLSENQHKMLLLLFDAARLADEIFWLQNVGEKEAFLAGIEDPALRRYAEINYGPWDELNNLTPFIEGYGPKPPGAEFYPHNMTKEEFERFDDPDKTSLYTLIRENEDEKDKLKTVWYHEAYKERTEKMATLLDQASDLAEDPGFANYLLLRANALRTDDYFDSDMAWLDMKDNLVDIVIGPIENYTDGLFGYKAAYEAYILIKDVAWSQLVTVT